MVIAKCFLAVVVGLLAVVVLNLGVDVITHAFAPTWDDLVENDRKALLARSKAIWVWRFSVAMHPKMTSRIATPWASAHL